MRRWFLIAKLKPSKPCCWRWLGRSFLSTGSRCTKNNGSVSSGPHWSLGVDEAVFHEIHIPVRADDRRPATRQRPRHPIAYRHCCHTDRRERIVGSVREFKHSPVCVRVQESTAVSSPTPTQDHTASSSGAQSRTNACTVRPSTISPTPFDRWSKCGAICCQNQSERLLPPDDISGGSVVSSCLLSTALNSAFSRSNVPEPATGASPKRSGCQCSAVPL